MSEHEVGGVGGVGVGSRFGSADAAWEFILRGGDCPEGRAEALAWGWDWATDIVPELGPKAAEGSFFEPPTQPEAENDRGWLRAIHGKPDDPIEEVEAASAQRQAEPEPPLEVVVEAKETVVVEAPKALVVPRTAALGMGNEIKLNCQDAIYEALSLMNERHAVVDYNNKTVISGWGASTLNPAREAIVFYGKDSFLLRYSNWYVIIEFTSKKGIVNQDRVSIGHWWLAHPQRRTLRSVVFWPGRPAEVNRCLNVWLGWGVEPKEGDWSLIYDHILNVIAGGDQEYADYIVKWHAWSFQHPDEQAEVALVLIGQKGSGKGTVARWLSRVFGDHTFRITNQEQLVGKHNKHLGGTVLLVVDEAYWGGDKKGAGTLQAIITEDTLTIEPKGIDAFEVPNRLHVVILAEPGWVIPAGRHERRYATFEVSKSRLGDVAYFKALNSQINGGGPAAMFAELRSMDLGDWHPRQMPERLRQSTALQGQQMRTLPPMEQWWLSVLHNGRLPSRMAKQPNASLTRSLMKDAQERVPANRYVSDTSIKSFIHDKDRVGIIIHGKYRSSSNNGWAFLPLATCRSEWSRLYGPQDWENPAEDWE